MHTLPAARRGRRRLSQIYMKRWSRADPTCALAFTLFGAQSVFCERLIFCLSGVRAPQQRQIKRFGRSTTLPPPHDAVRNIVSTSMPGMNAGHLVAPVVAYKCVLQPVLCRFAPFRTKNAPSSKQKHTSYKYGTFLTKILGLNLIHNISYILVCF